MSAIKRHLENISVTVGGDGGFCDDTGELYPDVARQFAREEFVYRRCANILASESPARRETLTRRLWNVIDYTPFPEPLWALMKTLLD